MSATDAKQAAWRAALVLACRDRNIATIVHERAELAVLRRLLSATLIGGEAEYWALVEKELGS